MYRLVMHYVKWEEVPSDKVLDILSDVRIGEYIDNIPDAATEDVTSVMYGDMKFVKGVLTTKEDEFALVYKRIE